MFEKNWNSPPFSGAPFFFFLSFVYHWETSISHYVVISQSCHLYILQEPNERFCTFDFRLVSSVYKSTKCIFFLIQNALCILLHWCATVVHAFWCSTPLCLLFKSGWRLKLTLIYRILWKQCCPNFMTSSFWLCISGSSTSM